MEGQVSVTRRASKSEFPLTACASCLLPLLLALTAAGQAQDYTYEVIDGTISITEYLGPGGAVTIPSLINGLPVTSIGGGAFEACTSLTDVTIPNSVISIGEYAFANPSLSAIVVDALNSFYSSVDGVLFDQTQATLIQYPAGKAGSYKIPNSVTSIGNSAFYYCAGLTHVTIPDSVTSLGDYAFYYCTSLTGVTIPNSVTSLGDDAFWNCTSLTNVTIGNGVISIEYGAFSGCSSLTRVTIPNSVTSLGDYAFASCSSLTNVTIGNLVTSLGNSAFSSCASLTRITIPTSVTSLGRWAFEGCTNLTGVYFQGDAPSVGSGVFDRANKAIVYYLPGTTGWDSTFGGRPTVLWNPRAQTSGASFGVQTNRFGFTISGSSNLAIVVEACTNLTLRVWSPLQTNTLTGGSSYFSDAQWTNYSTRFYRLRLP